MEEKGNEASGILNLVLVFGAGALGFVVINSITMLLTSRSIILWAVFFISAFVCFFIWPLDRAIESDLKDIGKEP